MADPKSFFLSSSIHEYLVAHGTPPDVVCRDLIEATAELGGVSVMQIAPEQGAFMQLLTRLLGVRLAVEVGTFTGYSALCIARGLAPEGRLICCDVSEEWTGLARRALGPGRLSRTGSTCGSPPPSTRSAPCRRIR